jgi:hypothetical protein
VSTLIANSRRAVFDIGPLISFRMAGVRGRGRRAAKSAAGVFILLTLLAAGVPAYLPGAATPEKANDLLILLPTAYVAFMMTVTLAAIGSGGGRELLPRDQAVAFPVSPVTDHLGALLLAPLNIAWIIQCWCLLGITAFVAGPHRLVLVQLTVVLWIVAATAVGQLAAWSVEYLRRRPHGILVVRVLWGLLATAVAILVASGRVAWFFDSLPSPWIAIVVLAPAGGGAWWTWVVGVAAFLALGLVATVVGGLLAHVVARRAPREEAKAEGRTFVPLPMPRTDFSALVRTDRASVWRSIPLRRGFAVLALLPGLVAAGGQLSWDMMPILPGLVAAGGALLFGINAWCLDGVGALWRDSLPVDPKVALAARMRVLFEILLSATVLTVLVAGLRAGGLPSRSELAALVATVVVVTLQVVARSMQWSVRRPYAMDLRSARGTPAPPFAMLSYSGWLAFSSTMTGMVFAVTAKAPDPGWSLVLALPFVIAAVRRLVITSNEWTDPLIRARVIATVSAR